MGRSDRAFTLVEMLAVMAIAAIMGVMAIGAYAGLSRRAARTGAVADVMGLLRQARISAVDSGRGAVVRINTADGSLFGLASKVVAAWHFEETYARGSGASTVYWTPGARGYDGELQADAQISDIAGGAGLCLELDGDADYVRCPPQTAFNLPEGIRVEVMVRPTGGTATQDLVVASQTDGTDGWKLWLQCTDADGPGEYDVRADVATRDDLDDGTNLLALRSDELVIGGGQWHLLAFEYDGFEARLEVNGALADLDSWDDDGDEDPNDTTDKQFDGDPPSPLRLTRDRDLCIGADEGNDEFEGQIDELKLLEVAGGQRVRLPEGVVLLAQNDAIYFDSQGYLDIGHHGGAVQIALGDPYQAAPLAAGIDGATTSISVTGANPFSVNGGLAIIASEMDDPPVYEIISYSGVDGQSLNDVLRGQWASGAPHRAGDRLYHARLIRISQTGVTTKVE